MRRTINVKPLLGQGKRYNVNIKKTLKMVKPHGLLQKDKEYSIRGKLADSLIKKGEAIEVKEEKTTLVTKEEKFTNTIISVKKLSEIIGTLTDSQLLDIIKSDDRVTAKRVATEEIKRREG